MANSALQIIGMVIGLIAGICTILAVILPEWRRNDPQGEVIESVVRQQGIWIRCTTLATGHWQCDDFDAFFLGLPQQLQVARGLAMISVVFLVFALILSIFGMECTKCMEGSPRTKIRVALIAATFYMLSSFSIGIAVSYYGHQIVQEYSFQTAIANANTLNQSTKFVFGTSLFLGWASMAIGIIGGALMMCGSCYVETDEDEYWNKGKVGKGVRRVRSSFRESYRAFRPRQQRNSNANTDYV